MRLPWPAPAIALAFVVGAVTVEAQELPAVDIYVVGPADATSRLQGALEAADRPIHWIVLDAMDLAQVTSPPLAGPQRTARVWVDCSVPTRVRVYFAAWATERFLLREVPLPGGLDALSLETLSQMIETSLSALVADRGAGMNRAQMGAALGVKPVPRSPAATATPFDVATGAFYAAQAFASDWPVEHGPGILLEALPGEGRVRVGGWVTAQYQLPETIATSLAGVRLDTVALRAGVELATPLSNDVLLSARIGAGGDVLQVAAREGTASQASLARARTYWDFRGQGAVGVRIRLPERLILLGAAVVDADFVLRHYDVDVDDRAVRIVTPWRVRPGLLAGVAWH